MVALVAGFDDIADRNWGVIYRLAPYTGALPRRGGGAHVWPGGGAHVRPGCGAWVTLCGVAAAAHYHVSWLRIWVMMMAVVRHVKVLCYRKSTKKSIYKSRFPATINFRVPKFTCLVALRKRLQKNVGSINEKKVQSKRVSETIFNFTFHNAEI